MHARTASTLCLLAILLLVAAAAAGAAGVVVRIDPDLAQASPWSVDKRIFGKFFESHGLDAEQGMVEYLLINGSFETPHFGPDGIPDVRRFFSIPTFEGTPYPWEPVRRPQDAPSGSVVLEYPEGGVHGKRPPRFQRIEIADPKVSGGVRQRIALPDRRVTEYVVELSVRGSVGDLSVRFEDSRGARLAEARVPVTSDWTRHTLRLELPEATGPRYTGSPSPVSPWFGVYYFALVAEGPGTLDVDFVTLRPADAVEGLYNPVTINRLREYNVTNIRWGGNYSSEYRWKTGVGPLQDRPVTDITRGGQQYNYMGTAEFLEIARIAGVEPILNVGFNPDITPQEAAEWVEYVNGGVDTPMGRLRAEHGYPEPWNVKVWMVGNEVYGDYQVGHTHEVDFARRVREYIAAMKAVDPEIKVIVAGVDPWYTHYSAAGRGTLPTWNETVFRLAGDVIDGIDIHRYTIGIQGAGAQSDQAHYAWLEAHRAEPVDFVQAMVAFPAAYEVLLADFTASAKRHGLDDLLIAVGEWTLHPVELPGWPRTTSLTTAHAAYVAGMLNAFIRQGELVRLAHHTDFGLWSDARPAGLVALEPGNYVFQMYAEPFVASDTKWHFLPVRSAGPVMTIPETGMTIPRTENVPLVDVAAVISEDGERLYAYIVNRDLKERHDVEIQLGAGDLGAPHPQRQHAVVKLLHAASPFLENTGWDEPREFRVDTEAVALDDAGRATLSMPPASVARVEFRLPAPGGSAGADGLPGPANEPADPDRLPGQVGSAFAYDVHRRNFERLRITSPWRGEVVGGGVPVRLETLGLAEPLRHVRVALDGREIYAGESLPHDLLVDGSALAAGRHALVVSGVDGSGEEHASTVEFTVAHARFGAGVDWGAVLRGVVEVGLEQLVPGDKMRSAAVEIRAVSGAGAGEMTALYAGKALPEALAVDTRDFADGPYDLVIRVVTAAGIESTVSQRVVFDNWSELEDELLPPVASGWFGTVERLKAVAKSGGWEYTSADPGAFYGDADRMRLAGPGEAFLVWELAGLRRFTFMLYRAADDAAGPAAQGATAKGAPEDPADRAAGRDGRVDLEAVRKNVRVEVSPDGKAWAPAPYTVTVAGDSGGGWVKLLLRGALGGDGGAGAAGAGSDGAGEDPAARFVRLAIAAGDAGEARSFELGSVLLEGAAGAAR